MLRGQVIRAAGGFFTVRDQESKVYHCRARGSLKRDKESLMVGDYVEFAPVQNPADSYGSEGVIETLIPRENRLTRPPVANIDQLTVVMSLKHPAADWQLISRLLVLAEVESMAAFVCLNKADLLSAQELLAVTTLLAPYPYELIQTSVLSGLGLSRLQENLAQRCSVFAGPSGAGKSSLLNAIQPGLALQTGLVSEKIKRGRHTTRQAELLSLDQGGLVVDTPGFTRLDFPPLAVTELANYFPEFSPYRGQCGFRDCLHVTEPDCVIRDRSGSDINQLRYDHYRYFLKEIANQEEIY